MSRLNEFQCAQIIALLEEGLSQSHIARRIGLPFLEYGLDIKKQADFVEEADKDEDE